MAEQTVAEYRRMLLEILEGRRGRNAFYGLRAFARDLRIAAPRLSEILSGKKGLSETAARQLAVRLFPAGEEAELRREIFVLSARATHSRSPVMRAQASQRLHAVWSGSAKLPPLIATQVGWVTEAVLAMSARAGFRSDPEAIARKLGLRPYLVTSALRFLTRLGLLQGVSPERAYLAARGRGRRLNVNPEQILEQGRNAVLKGSSLLHHVAICLDAGGARRAQEILRRALQEIQELGSTDSHARVHFANAQLFSVETSEGEKQ